MKKKKEKKNFRSTPMYWVGFVFNQNVYIFFSRKRDIILVIILKFW